MAVTHEVVWDYDMVEPGQAAQPITTEVTPCHGEMVSIRSQKIWAS